MDAKSVIHVGEVQSTGITQPRGVFCGLFDTTKGMTYCGICGIHFILKKLIVVKAVSDFRRILTPWIKASTKHLIGFEIAYLA